jgi:hypothetical protein
MNVMVKKNVTFNENTESKKFFKEAPSENIDPTQIKYSRTKIHDAPAPLIEDRWASVDDTPPQPPRRTVDATAPQIPRTTTDVDAPPQPPRRTVDAGRSFQQETGLLSEPELQEARQSISATLNQDQAPSEQQAVDQLSDAVRSAAKGLGKGVTNPSAPQDRDVSDVLQNSLASSVQGGFSK